MSNRVLLGKIGANYKLLIAKPSYDVTTAVKNEQLAFSSDWNEAGNILQVGQINLTASNYVRLPLPFYNTSLSCLAMAKKGGLFYPLNVLRCIMLTDETNHSVVLQSSYGSVTFSLGNSGASDIVYYAIMGNQF
ncbi:MULTISPECIES: hypothetical protein [unclassified Mesorhizobium]|uniref:hypothetical protein n=1 Tax=unclassified Mesorhizobium TaxID=325217 RepID=UPI001126846A|nr:MULTISPECIES: hypothetical protein [unclassified Mesorhizobium]TPJ51661.1 hypothetical protein FJ426_20735 [Mesorhizobium sp. B2-6-4]TPN42339.1 hypothetical protein FJ979_02015 [Mesorhizobium sp. B1-1-6]